MSHVIVESGSEVWEHITLLVRLVFMAASYISHSFPELSFCCPEMQVVRLIFLNMYLHITWSLSAIDPHSPDETAIASLLTIRARLIQHLYSFMDFVLDSWDQGNPRNVLTCTVCFELPQCLSWDYFFFSQFGRIGSLMFSNIVRIVGVKTLSVLSQMCLILSDVWSLFSEAKLAPTKLRALGFCPPMDILERFWQLCEYRLSYTGNLSLRAVVKCS